LRLQVSPLIGSARRLSDIKPDSQRYEESYSDDGGKTWALSFTADLTRSKP
jgi:hypothetical protein